MPPTIRIRLDGPVACNASSSGTCTISVQLANLTLGGDDNGASLTEAQQDGEGAMKFIIAVLLVYSLMGTAGMLILRIRRSATKTNNSKNQAAKEANHYLKYRDKINADCHRARLVKETNKVLNHIQALERQKSVKESITPPPNDGDQEQLSPLMPSDLDQQTMATTQTHASAVIGPQNTTPLDVKDTQPSPSPCQPSSSGSLH
ncbi:hypothetical protein RRG08_065102 [Elysia crispata]|uniref:Uncharacterized protein n=1 Tax=Elysia crispata TaxID=231223 RepID=A0AAE1DCE0_9GAST|nr:hypothetical protein RRG08_065102 [Elysia crispata]